MLLVTLKIYLIALHTSLVGMLWGLDTGESRGYLHTWLLTIPIGRFHRSLTQMVQFSNSIGCISSGQPGIYVACIPLSASISSLSSGHVADVISRKYGILTGGLIVNWDHYICLCKQFPCIDMCSSNNWHRTSAVHLSGDDLCVRDRSQKNCGTVATMLQLLITIGIASGYFIAYGSSRLDSSLAWRIPFIVEPCVAATLSIGMAFMPFSPRWLVQHGEARDVLSRLRQTDNVDEELHSIRGSLEEEGTHQATLSEVFSKRYIRRSLLGIFMMGFQMLCGVCVHFAVLIAIHCMFILADMSSVWTRSMPYRIMFPSSSPKPASHRNVHHSLLQGFREL